MSKQLWDSTSKFYQRFHVEDTPPLRRQRIVAEEFLEVIQASTLHNCELIIGEEIDPESIEHLTEEAADLIVTLYGLLMAHGIEFYELEQAMAEVAQKNDAKTDATHYKDGAGKISRRPKIAYFDYLQVFARKWPSSRDNTPVSKETWDGFTAAVQAELMDGMAAPKVEPRIIQTPEYESDNWQQDVSNQQQEHYHQQYHDFD